MLNLREVAAINLNLNEMSTNITDSIKRVAFKINMRNCNNKLYHKVNKPWFDIECRDFRSLLDEEYKNVKKNKFQSVKVKYLHKLRNEYFKFINIKKNRFLENRAESIRTTRDPKEFWGLLNSFKSYRKSENNTIDLNTWYKYFQNVYTPKINSNTCNLLGVSNNEMLDYNITFDEIILALQSSKLKKNQGLYGVSNEFLKYLPENWLLYINVLFNRVMREERVPDSWLDIETKKDI